MEKGLLDHGNRVKVEQENSDKAKRRTERINMATEGKPN